MLKQANLSFSVAAQSFGDDVTSIQFSTQDRNTAKLIFTIREGKQPLNLTDVEGIVDLVMGDKSIFEDNKATVTAPLDGKLEYTITADQIRHPGRARGELQLVKKDGQSLGGFRFNFTIKKALVDEYAGPVKEYYVQDLEAIKAEIRKTADSIKDLDVVRIDSKLNELEQKVEEGGVGVDEQARQKIEEVTTQLEDAEKALESIENANSPNAMPIINYLNNTQNTHPKVLRFASPWNGYTYWMAYTPYPNGNIAHENPCIAVSNDKLNWTVPNGLTNPLDPQPSTGFNSDTHLIYREDTKVMEIWWRAVNTENSTRTIFRRTSTNGINWTPKEEVMSTTYSGDVIAPSVIFEDGKYKIWFVNEGTKRDIYYMESVGDSISQWSTRRKINIDWGDLNPWHPDVIKTELGYELITTAYGPGGDNNSADLYYVLIKADGTVTKPKLILGRSKNPSAIDHTGIYRSSILKENGIYYIFYASISADDRRHISLSYGKNIHALNGWVNQKASRTGERAVTLEPGAVLTNFNVENIDTVYLKSGAQYTINTLVGGYNGKVVEFIAVGGDAKANFINGSLMVIVGGNNYLFDSKRELSIRLICTTVSGNQWRLDTKLDSFGVANMPNVETLEGYNVSNIHTLHFQSNVKTTIQSLSGGYVGQKIDIMISGSITNVVIPNSDSISTPGRTTLSLNIDTGGVRLVCVGTNTWKVVGLPGGMAAKRTYRSLTTGGDVTNYDVTGLDMLTFQSSTEFNLNSLTGGYVGQKIDLISMGSATKVNLINSGSLVLPGGTNFVLDASVIGISLVCMPTIGTWRMFKV